MTKPRNKQGTRKLRSRTGKKVRSCFRMVGWSSQAKPWKTIGPAPSKRYCPHCPNLMWPDLTEGSIWDKVGHSNRTSQRISNELRGRRKFDNIWQLAWFDAQKQCFLLLVRILHRLPSHLLPGPLPCGVGGKAIRLVFHCQPDNTWRRSGSGSPYHSDAQCDDPALQAQAEPCSRWACVETTMA